LQLQFDIRRDAHRRRLKDVFIARAIRRSEEVDRIRIYCLFVIHINILLGYNILIIFVDT